MAKGVVMLLCGLPASGKTYISNLLQQSGDNPDVHIFHVCYDELIPSNLCPSGTKDNLSWKHYRRLIVKCVEKILLTYSGHKSTCGDYSEVNNDQPIFGDFWIDFIKNQTAKQRTCCFSLESQNWVDTCHVFLIDDNMFYRSMRHEYFLLARKYGLGYAQVFIDCPLETAINANRLRPNPVETKTIVTMAAKMEAPLPEKFAWEINSMKLDKVGRTSALKKLYTLIRRAAENPVLPLEEEDQAVKEKSRAALLASVLYQTDQTLRKVISEQMRIVKEEGYTKQEMKTLAEEENAKRKYFLEELKNVIVISNNEFHHMDNQTEAECDQTDIQQQLTHLLAQTSTDNYMNECIKILKTFINKNHFDIAVKCMFKHYSFNNQ